MKIILTILTLSFGLINAEEKLPPNVDTFLKSFLGGKYEEALKVTSDNGVKEDSPKGSAKKFVKSYSAPI